jgi:hypothetical protein
MAWRNGLKEWGIGPDRILALKNAAEFVVYTPGSDIKPVSVLSSLAAPDVSWDGNREILREKITSTVTALLGLVGFDDVDPVRSREHILLSNIFESAWSEGKNVDLTELILQTQTPPFDKLGAFPVDTFFPPKERMDLAMVLNNILASPAFETWRMGLSLDIQSLLYTEDGRPRHNIFYLAHLSDRERMFFVTLLLASVEAWMRMQKGTSGLRALLYMDEIYGYIPPTSNPPSKPLFMRMVKQARAFGLGLLLATQNPVDVDYKALSNAGTWFIGKLQTDQDKQRLLDGLTGAVSGVSRDLFDDLISSLGKRVFILHNVHAKAPTLFQTRWTMNFLAGPLTRVQIPQLNEISSPISVNAETAATLNTPMVNAPKTNSFVATKSELTGGTQTKPPLPAGIREYYLPQNYSLPEAFSSAQRPMPNDAMIQGVVYKPSLLAAAQVRILDRKYGVDTEITRAALVISPDKRGIIRWDDFAYNGPSLDKVETMPAPSARFGAIDSPLNDSKLMTSLQKDFIDWVIRNSSVTARANTTLKVFAGPDVSQADFMKACADTAREARDAEIAKKTATIDRQIKTLQDKMAREERELREDEADLQHRKMEEMGTHAENVLGLFTGSRSTRKLSSSLSKRRMTENAKAEVEESVDAISQFKKQLAELGRQREEMIAEINDRWGRVVNEISEVTINPKKTDVFVNLFGVAWLPYYIVQAGLDELELPAFGAG